MKSNTARFRITTLVAAMVFAASGIASAALQDISQAPLASASSTLVKPNISYVLDTSGSMAWTHAPDESQPWFDNVGYKTSQCNSIYYNPNILYPPARNYDGTQMANSSFTAAPKDGFHSFDGGSAATVNLATSFYAYDASSGNTSSGDTPQPAYYYNYLGSQVATGLAYQSTTSQFYKECNAAEGPNPTATIVFAGSSNTQITSITVNGTNIMSGPTSATTSSSTLASSTAALITASGYTATASGSTVTINGPTSVAGVPIVVNATPPFPNATLTFSGSTSTSVTGIKVNGVQLVGSASTAASTPTAVASAVATVINQNGFSATSSGAVVTITGPLSAATFTPVVTEAAGTNTATVTFSGSVNTQVSAIKVNGLNIMAGTSAPSTSSSTLASSVAALISVGGYSATASGSVVTITGPLTSSGFTPVVTTGAGSSTTITFSAANNAVVTSITVGGTTITSGSTASSSTNSTVASNVAAKITLAGYSATSSGAVVTINGPASAAGSSPVVSKTGTLTSATSAFSVGGSSMTSSTTAFVSGGTMGVATTAFPAVGVMTATLNGFSPFAKVIVSATSGPGGTDERLNFANWFTYYRMRILMMKSGLGRAFVGVGSNYRVGFMTIYTTPSSSTTDPGYLAISDYVTAQKQSWFTKVYSQTPGGSTPLKTALSTASRNIAGKVGPDPQQYSCQQNFILLSTDGYWNSGTPNGTQLNGSTAIGNQDNNIATAPRPQYDGGLAGSTNTLADVAWYYYNTDLRPTTGTCNTGPSGADVCQDNVPTSGLDTAPWQHVTLFTLGLGTNGQLVYNTSYLTGGSADYNAISSGTKNWPSPVGDQLTTIDDLWHAAVNGHGQYFSAKNPDLLVAGLNTALAGVSARIAAGAAAATSNLEPVAGDNFAFLGDYTTQEWTGDLQSHSINLTDGSIAAAANWSAQALLDLATTDTTDTRNIFTFLAGSKTPFIPSNFSSAQKASWFTPANAPALSQYASWTAAQIAAGTPDTVINYLRGQWGNEERGTNPAVNQLYRVRTHVMGDIINSKPAYMRLPPFLYTENNYPAFQASIASRNGTVFVGANDGMLHAFDGISGNEIWAYIPSFVLPNLKALASDDYTNNHKYYVDGSPVITDIWTGSQWKTIIVGGLNGGGKGYYAIDITNPAVPNILWEYSDTNLGFTFGNPIIGKLTNGTWVVVFSSGYNNVGDGVGRLYVLDAATGALKFTVSTGVGSATSPSGLGKISGWVDNGLSDNTIQRVYGGDMFGNLWRFDINNQYLPAGIDALQLAYFQAGTYQQPITTQPQLALVNSKPVVYVGTGRYLGASDLIDLNQQSLYAIVDKLTGTGLGNARTETTCPLVQQSLTVIDANTRSTTTLPVDLATTCGWFLDFNPPGGNTPGERVNIDMALQQGVLTVGTNIPETSVCTVGGSSFIYFFDYSTGRFVSTSTGGVSGSKAGNAMLVGLGEFQLQSGAGTSGSGQGGGGGGGINVISLTFSDNSHKTETPPANPLSGAIGRRVMWRELLQ